jgi:hypothetical protein
MRWVENLFSLMEKKRNSCKVSVGKPKGKRGLENPRP